MNQFSVDTPVGQIAVVANPDPAYPGVWIKVNGEDLILVEYDEQASTHFAHVWTQKRNEDGVDPIAKIDLASDK